MSFGNEICSFLEKMAIFGKEGILLGKRPIFAFFCSRDLALD
jgi:hypothetical protein